MIHKKNLNYRLVFAIMVPVSIIAFILGIETIGLAIGDFSVYDGVRYNERLIK